MMLYPFSRAFKKIIFFFSPPERDDLSHKFCLVEVQLFCQLNPFALCRVPGTHQVTLTPEPFAPGYTAVTAEPLRQISTLGSQNKQFSTALCTKPRKQPTLKRQDQTLSLECCTFNSLFLNALTTSHLTQSLTPRKYPLHLLFSKKVPGRSAGQSSVVKIQTTQAK